MNEPMQNDTQHELNVSKSWRIKFDILKKLGADEHSTFKALNMRYRDLSFSERSKISFNFLAFFFGPLYYFSKQMWAKGLVLIGITWIIATLFTITELVFDITIPYPIYWLPISVICAQLANYDYYRSVIHSEKMWRNMPKFLSSPLGSIGFALIALALSLGVTMYTPAFLQDTESQILDDVSGLWRSEKNGTMITVALNGESKALYAEGIEIPVTVESIDQDNNIITLDIISTDGTHASLVIRQLFDEDDSFTLLLTMQDGKQDELTFVSTDIKRPTSQLATLAPQVATPVETPVEPALVEVEQGNENFPLSHTSWSATLLEVKGMDSEDATAFGKVMRINANEYCVRDPGGETGGTEAGIAKCIDTVLQEENGKTYSISANCIKKSIVTSHLGTFVFTGLYKDDEGFPLYPWKNEATGEQLDGGMASGGATVDAQFELVCPSFKTGN